MMPAAVLAGAGRLAIEERPEPVASADEQDVLVDGRGLRDLRDRPEDPRRAVIRRRPG